MQYRILPPQSCRSDTSAQLLQVEQQLRQTGLLLTTEDDYADDVFGEAGLIIEGVANGQGHLFFAMNAGQIENDHFPLLRACFQAR